MPVSFIAIDAKFISKTRTFNGKIKLQFKIHKFFKEGKG